MSTFVDCQRRARAVRSNSFDDLLPEGVHVTDIRADGVEFDADLDEQTVTLIRDRMASRDDTDQAARAVLRADRDALAGDDPLRRLYGYVLGE